MGQQVPLTLSLDDALDISFADDLLSQFDLKRDLLHSTNTINDGNQPSLLAINDSPASINNKLNRIPSSTLPPTSQYQVNNDRLDSTTKINQDSGITPTTTEDLTSLLPPELMDNVTLNTTLSLPLTNLGTSHQRDHDVSMDSTKVKTKSTPASLPGTITDRSHRRRQNNLLRRSSTYLRQKFFAGEAAAEAAAESSPPPPPLPTINLTDRNDFTNNNSIHSQRTKPTLPLSLPPTPPSSTIPSSPPPPPPSNPDMNTNITTTNMVTPQISPCQYPPKPLQYCPVDPPNDRHRASFPIFSWRKKYLKEPRRQSEPTITSDHIKTRKSFFFL